MVLCAFWLKMRLTEKLGRTPVDTSRCNTSEACAPRASKLFRKRVLAIVRAPTLLVFEFDVDSCTDRPWAFVEPELAVESAAAPVVESGLATVVESPACTLGLGS